jgi:hypothetical protein
MSTYAGSVGGTYQAPLRYDSGYEPGPAGSTIQDGSNMPDYVTFCLDCHQYELYDPERGEPVKAIDYANERHGGLTSNDCTHGLPMSPPYGEGYLKAPYTDDGSPTNYVLSCTDCHEPHGTPNRMFLIRRVINGQLLPEDIATGGISQCDTDGDINCICMKCHDWPHSNTTGPTGDGCDDGSGGCSSGQCHGNIDRLGAQQELHGSHYTYGEGGTGCENSPAF